MTFTGLSSSNTLRLSRYGSPPAASFQYRLGSGSWTDLPENTNVAVAENQTMQVRAKGGEQRMGSSLNNFRWFQMTGRFKAAGNVMSLLDRSEQLTSVDNYAFANAFSKGHENYSVVSTLVDAKDLVLPAPRIRDSGYRGMFRGQALLSAVANVSALTADQYAFNSMYEACYGLLDVPAFQAVQANGTHTWSYMFINCRSLTGVPDEMFPESLNGSNICQEAFRNCSSLTKTPRLKAKKVTGYQAMQGMFQGCSNLSNIQTDMTAWTNQNNWVNGVAASGIFTCPSALGTNETIERGASRCPQNWQVVNWEHMLNAVKFTAAAGGAKVGIVDRQEAGLAPTIQMLSSTDGISWGDYSVGGKIQLQEGETAYFKAKTTNNKMGSDWGRANSFFVEDGQASAAGPLTALLGQEPAELTDFCFYNLFAYCSGLVDASGIEFPASKPQGQACYSSMFWNCSALTAAPETELPKGDNLDSDVYNSMFRWCTGLSDASKLKLPTAAGQNCFRHMFEGCVSLTAAPQVPAPGTGSTSYLFSDMFNGCTSLAQISAKFDEWPSGTDNWVNGVSADGTFYCYESLGTDQTIMRGVSKCPTGWNVVNMEKVKYLQWVETQGNPMALGVTADNDLCCHTILSGTANGGYFIVNMPDDQFSDDEDWRFFNLDSRYFYVDVGTARTSTSNGWNSSGWNNISTWNCGVWINGYSSSTSPGTGVYEAELSIKNANSVKFRELQFWKGAEILADLKPAIDVNGVVGFWDVVNEQFRAPQGAWLSGPPLT